MTDEIETEEGRLPLFENSEVVGSFVDAYIDTIEIDGVSKQVLIGNAFICEHRYKALVDWLAEQVPNGKVMGPVEIVGVPENKNVIIYEGGYVDKGRVPMEYMYSGHVLRSNCVAPANDAAVVLEINKQMEVENMDAADVKQVVTETVQAVLEVNACKEAYEQKIAELNSALETGEAVAGELRMALEGAQRELREAHEKADGLYGEIDALRKNLGEVQARERVAALNQALESFSDGEKEIAKEEIEAFLADPMAMEINSITARIYAEIGRAAKAQAVEINTRQVVAEDIYSEMFGTDDADAEADVAIFKRKKGNA